MGAEIGAFFDQEDAEISSLFRSQLFKADRRGQAGLATADDDCVEFHGITFHGSP